MGKLSVKIVDATAGFRSVSTGHISRELVGGQNSPFLISKDCVFCPGGSGKPHWAIARMGRPIVHPFLALVVVHFQGERRKERIPPSSPSDSSHSHFNSPRRRPPS